MVYVQTVGLVVTAVSVSVAALYYILTLRETNRKRRVDFSINLNNFLNSEEAMLRFRELMNMEYSDYSDFEHKYGSDTNPDNFAKRQAAWWNYNTLGHVLKSGMIDAESIYALNGESCIWIWEKSRGLIEEARRRYNGTDFMRDYEFLYGEMMRLKLRNDPGFKVPSTFSKFVDAKT